MATRTTKPRHSRRAKKSAENPEIRRAAERMNDKAEETLDPYEAATAHVLALVGEHLVKACDSLGEEVAAIAESGGGDNYNVVQALLRLWELRWTLGMTGGDNVKVDAKAGEYPLKRAVGAVHKMASANGAAAGAS